MLIDDFVNNAMKQDSRNVFGISNFSDMPEILKDLYQRADPVDVEITMDGNAVRLIPANELVNIQSEYSLGNERFVFASCNGDPIYVYKGKIYTCCHGTNNVKDELLAEDLFSFLDLID